MVNVADLERRLRQRATEVGCRLDVRRAGVVRLLVEAVARLREAGRIRELRDSNLRLFLSHAICIRTRDNA